MALSGSDKSLIYNIAMDVWQNDFMTNHYTHGSSVGKSLRDMVLARQPVQPLTNPMEEALTGTLRADAAAVRQNARNVGEAANMVGVAKEGVDEIASALADMDDIIDRINEGELSASDSAVQEEYDSLKSKIQGIISNTDFNGIYVLDSSQWGTEQIDSSGNVYIQAYKDGGFNVTMHAVDSLNFAGLDGASLASDLSGQTSLVDSLQSDVDSYVDTYATKLTSLQNQRASLENQADILYQAVDARRPSSNVSAEQFLMNLIFGDSGSIVDTDS